MGKNNRGLSSIRVKKQKPTRQAKKVNHKSEAFLSKPNTFYSTPRSLKLLLQNICPNFEHRTIRSDYKEQNRLKVKKTSLNGFIAFRTYYSNIGKSYEDQSKLSTKLAQIWKCDISLQKVWDSFAEEYNISESHLPFIHWFEKNKTQLKPKDDVFIMQRANISHLVVEDIYEPTDNSYNKTKSSA